MLPACPQTRTTLPPLPAGTAAGRAGAAACRTGRPRTGERRTFILQRQWELKAVASPCLPAAACCRAAQRFSQLSLTSFVEPTHPNPPFQFGPCNTTTQALTERLAGLRRIEEELRAKAQRVQREAGDAAAAEARAQGLVDSAAAARERVDAAANDVGRRQAELGERLEAFERQQAVVAEAARVGARKARVNIRRTNEKATRARAEAAQARADAQEARGATAALQLVSGPNGFRSVGSRAMRYCEVVSPTTEAATVLLAQRVARRT